jgi:penicillin-binding protein 2
MGNSMRAETSGIRLSILGVTVIGLFAALFSRLWFLQVAAEPGLERIVASNRIRTVPLPPTRGRILDEKGRVLADNRQGLSVVIDRNGIRKDKKRFDVFLLLSGPLNKTVAEMEARYKDVLYDPLLPLPLAEDVPETMAIFMRERITDYPGVDVVDSGQRSYRFSPVASAIVGYMGKIQKGSEQTYSKENGYAPNDLVGIYGIEKTFEKDLRGKPGSRRVEIDSNNRVVRVLDQVDPEPGLDVQLTIDIKKQQYVEQILQAEILKRRTERPLGKTDLINGGRGASGPLFKAPEGAVAVLTTDGDVVALGSNPGFDNRWYDGTTDGKVLQSLFGSHDEIDPVTQQPILVPNNNAPLVDRSISTQFQIGSTMKLFTSVAAIRYGLLDPSRKYNDTGKWQLRPEQCRPDEPNGCSKNNADGAVYGEVNLSEALAVSSDSYFYTLGESLWLDTVTGTYALQTELRSFGMGSKLGIDLPNETSGLIPDAEVKKALAKKGVIDKFAGSKFFTGDNVQLSIGQGLLGVSGLQLANGYATFANGGTLYKPRIAKAIFAPGTPDLAYGLADVKNAVKVRDIPVEKLGEVDLPEEMTTPIKKGLRGVISGGTFGTGGQSSTAGDVFTDWDFEEFPIWGKTGTAQGANQKSEFDSSLFASFGGPKNEPPKYAIASIIKEAGFGGQASAPLVKCIWTALMNEKNMPELLPVTPLDRANPVPRAPAVPPDFDASCLNVVLNSNRKEA